MKRTTYKSKSDEHIVPCKMPANNIQFGDEAEDQHDERDGQKRPTDNEDCLARARAEDWRHGGLGLS